MEEVQVVDFEGKRSMEMRRCLLVFPGGFDEWWLNVQRLEGSADDEARVFSNNMHKICRKALNHS